MKNTKRILCIISGRSNCRRGFTLLELILALTIVGITGILCGQFLWPHLNSYESLSARTDARYLCDTLYQDLEAELRFGRDYQAQKDGSLSYLVVEPDGSETELSLPGIYDSSTCNYIPADFTIKVSYKQAKTGDMVTITMVVCKDGAASDNQVYQQAAVVRSLY